MGGPPKGKKAGWIDRYLQSRKDDLRFVQDKGLAEQLPEALLAPFQGQREKALDFLAQMTAYFGDDQDKALEHYRKFKRLRVGNDVVFVREEYAAALGRALAEAGTATPAVTDHYSARKGVKSPGHAMHELGLSIDFDAKANPQIKDLKLVALQQIVTNGPEGYHLNNKAMPKGTSEEALESVRVENRRVRAASKAFQDGLPQASKDELSQLRERYFRLMEPTGHYKYKKGSDRVAFGYPAEAWTVLRRAEELLAPWREAVEKALAAENQRIAAALDDAIRRKPPDETIANITKWRTVLRDLRNRLTVNDASPASFADFVFGATAKDNAVSDPSVLQLLKRGYYNLDEDFVVAMKRTGKFRHLGEAQAGSVDSMHFDMYDERDRLRLTNPQARAAGVFEAWQLRPIKDYFNAAMKAGGPPPESSRLAASALPKPMAKAVRALAAQGSYADLTSYGAIIEQQQVFAVYYTEGDVERLDVFDKAGQKLASGSRKLHLDLYDGGPPKSYSEVPGGPAPILD